MWDLSLEVSEVNEWNDRPKRAVFGCFSLFQGLEKTLLPSVFSICVAGLLPSLPAVVFVNVNGKLKNFRKSSSLPLCPMYI